MPKSAVHDDIHDNSAATARPILERLLTGYEGPVAIRLWDGTRLGGASPAPCTLVFHGPAPLRRVVLRRDLMQLAEDYLSGEVDVVGRVEAVFDLVDFLQRRGLHLNDWRVLWSAMKLPRSPREASAPQRRAGQELRQNSRASIAHHYDVGNDFYQLWLDPEMVYSCAYFRDAEQPLAQAQQDKLDYICRKLRLAPGMQLLDIGCGWGALACWAARYHGAQVHGITLSMQQYQHALAKVRRLGLEDRVRIELRDYRDLPQEPCYDRVVSVGMFEHVGVKNFPRYFSTVRAVLKPGGLFLNHGITNDEGWEHTPVQQFINRYVFPDGELARISDVAQAMEQEGFEIVDVEGLRPHYALTLRHWLHALESHSASATRQVGDAVYRIWRLYMAGAAHYFEQGTLGVYQVLAGHVCQPLATPLRRDDLYTKPALRERASAVGMQAD